MYLVGREALLNFIFDCTHLHMKYIYYNNTTDVLFHYDLTKFSFTNRTVNIWNSLPNAVVDVDSADLFKSRLDNFWMFQNLRC